MSSSSSESEHTSDSESSSSSESSVESDEEMELFRQTGISDDCRRMIHQIKNNEESLTGFVCKHYYDSVIIREHFTNQAWQLFGRYIANNTHLKNLDIPECSITDEKAAVLFGELTNSTSLEMLDIGNNEFGIVGVRSMVPLLQNSPHLISLYVRYNMNINSECFDLLVSALHNTNIRKLYFHHCNITDISALSTYKLPNIRKLTLCGNNIGRKGCIILSNLLQKEGSALIELDLENTNIDDDGAEILAASLKNNTKLEELNLQINNITNKGREAFLKLLVDVSSIDNTYKSNNTLIEVSLDGEYDVIERIVRFRLNRLNRCQQSSHSVGREKVIKYQLNSQKRKSLCQLQGIEYSFNIFADIDPILLPNIIALIGDRHGQSELYTALIPTAPDLLSYIDRKAFIDRAVAKNEAKAAVLSHECAQKVAKYNRKLKNIRRNTRRKWLP